MKKIELVHEGEDYIKISYEEDGEKQEAEITGIAIDVIKTMGRALMKSSFAKYPKGASKD